MSKVIIGLGVIVALGIGWFFFTADTIEYVAVVEDEITQLESELAVLEAAVQAGTLTPEAALEAQAKIVARIDSITTATTDGKNARLTDQERAELAVGLNRLVSALERYKGTLTAIDEAVERLPEERRRASGTVIKKVAVAAAQATVTAETEIEALLEDISDEEIAESAEEDIEAAIEEVAEELSELEEALPVAEEAATGTESVAKDVIDEELVDEEVEGESEITVDENSAETETEVETNS